MEELTPGNIVNANSQELFTYNDPCVELGAGIGYNHAAHTAAVRDVKSFLSELFALK